MTAFHGYSGARGTFFLTCCFAALFLPGEVRAGESEAVPPPEGKPSSIAPIDLGAFAELVKQADEKIKMGQYIECRDWLKEEIIRLCPDPAKLQPGPVRELYYRYALSRNMPFIKERIHNPADADALTNWLLTNRKFTERLFLALDSKDDVGKALSVLLDLLKAFGQRVQQFEELAIAFVIVWDVSAYDPQNHLAHFDYLTRRANHLPINPTTLPYQLSKYVVNTQCSKKEREWAAGLFSSSANVARLYEMIPYDDRAYKYGMKQVEEKGYNLENIRRYGGVCAERAYFAAEVGKTAGVPTVEVSGRGSSGIYHAWVGFLRRSEKEWEWDFKTGRYKSGHYYTGLTKDPQDGSVVTDHDVELDAAAARLPAEKRDLALLLRKMADLFRDHPEAAARWILAALRENRYDKKSWLRFAELAAAGAVPDNVINQQFSMLLTEFREYPDLAVDVFERLIKTVPKEDKVRRRRLYESMIGRYSSRPDLVLRLRVMMGQYLESIGSGREAIQLYSQGLLDFFDEGPMALELLDHIIEYYRGQRQLRAAVQFVHNVFQKIHKPERSAYVRHTTYYAVGERLARLYREIGDANQASQIEREIASRDTTHEQKSKGKE